MYSVSYLFAACRRSLASLLFLQLLQLRGEWSHFGFVLETQLWQFGLTCFLLHLNQRQQRLMSCSTWQHGVTWKHLHVTKRIIITRSFVTWISFTHRTQIHWCIMYRNKTDIAWTHNTEQSSQRHTPCDLGQWWFTQPAVMNKVNGSMSTQDISIIQTRQYCIITSDSFALFKG